MRKRVETDGNEWWKFAKDNFDDTRKELETVMHAPASKAAKAAIEANPEFAGVSDREVAKKIGVSDKTVAKARNSTADYSAVEKRVGKDGKARKLPEPKAAPKTQHPEPQPTRSKKPMKPVAGLSVIQQVSAFHSELYHWIDDFCTNVETWLATNPDLGDEAFRSMYIHRMYNGLETSAMRLQRLAQALDGR